MEKPTYIFDRDFEWDNLSRFVSTQSSDLRLGVVSGRRRQGKTFLLEAISQAASGFYFTATEGTSEDSLREFSAALATYTKAVAPYMFVNWDDAIRGMYEAIPNGIIVIDEFPHLIRAAPAVPSIIQRALDPRGHAHQGSTAQLLLCGSAMSVMGKLLAGHAPLRGRASLELVVQPFNYKDAAQFWNIDDPRLAFLVYAIVGGTPAYRRSFVAGNAPSSRQDFDDWVQRTVLNPAVPIFREARYLLAEETDIREPGIYHSVLAAIAAGNATRGGIANYLGRQSAEFNHPLNVLEDCGLITQEADAFHSRRATFRITEPLITFYESIMRTQWTLLEQGLGEQVWESMQNTFMSNVVGPSFENICRRWTLTSFTSGLLSSLPSSVISGTLSDANNKTQLEIDVVALGIEKKHVLLLGECKWGKEMNISDLNRLRRAKDLLLANGYDVSDTKLACYSGAGFHDELHEIAEREQQVVLIGLEKLYGRL